MRSAPDDRAHPLRGLFVFLAFAAGSLLLFGRMLTAWFQEDDFDLLYGVASGGPFGRWTFAPTGFFRPLVSLTLWAQHALWGLNPTPFRVFNDLVHAGVATTLVFLVYEVLRDRIPPDNARYAGLVAGLLFLVSPSHVEAVNWIAARTDLLSALFGLLSLWAFVRFTRVGAKRWLAASLIFFACGILCKESVLLVPVLCATYWALFRGRGNSRTATFAYVGVTLAYVALRAFLIGTEINGNLSRSTGFKAVGSMGAQVTRSLLPGLPWGDPDLNNSEVLRTPIGLAYLGLGVVILVATAFVVLRRFRDRRIFVFWAVAFACALLPTFGLSVRLFRSQGERFVYFPSAFVLAFVVCAFLARNKPSSSPVGSGKHLLALGLALAASVVAVQIQMGYWVQGATLSERVQKSFVRDVVQTLPSGSSNVALLDLPVCVQGGYGVAYVFETVAPLYHPDRKPKVDVVSMFGLRSLDHRVELIRERSVVRMLVWGGGARFSLEATQTGRPIDPENLSASGYLKFDPREVVFDTASLPPDAKVFAWNGARFIPWPATEN